MLWKHFVLFCSVVVASYGQEVSHVLNAEVKLEENVTGLLGKLNQTVSSFCQDAQLCDSNQEWKLAFRGTAGVGRSVYAAYRDGAGIPLILESGCKQVGKSLPCNNHYRNDAILDNWKSISDVAFILYKNNVKVRHVIFDGANTTYMTWFDKAKIKETVWPDMRTSSSNYFSILGHQDASLKRAFFMSQSYGTCPNDFGWFVALDAPEGGCTWEQSEAYPNLRYSLLDTRVNWNDADVGSADYFGVFVRYYNLP